MNKKTGQNIYFVVMLAAMLFLACCKSVGVIPDKSERIEHNPHSKGARE